MKHFSRYSGFPFTEITYFSVNYTKYKRRKKGEMKVLRQFLLVKKNLLSCGNMISQFYLSLIQQNWMPGIVANINHRKSKNMNGNSVFLYKYISYFKIHFYLYLLTYKCKANWQRYTGGKVKSWGGLFLCNRWS